MIDFESWYVPQKHQVAIGRNLFEIVLPLQGQPIANPIAVAYLMGDVKIVLSKMGHTVNLAVDATLTEYSGTVLGQGRIHKPLLAATLIALNAPVPEILRIFQPEDVSIIDAVREAEAEHVAGGYWLVGAVDLSKAKGKFFVHFAGPRGLIVEISSLDGITGEYVYLEKDKAVC